MYIALFLALIAAVAFFLTARVHVAEGQYAVIERLGKFQQVFPPGKYFIIPVVDKVAVLLSSAPRSETFKLPVPLAANQVFHIVLALQWQLQYTKPEQVMHAAYSFRDPVKRSEVIAIAVQHSLSSFFAARSLSLSFQDYDVISDALKLKLGPVFQSMGCRLDGLQLKDIYLASA